MTISIISIFIIIFSILTLALNIRSIYLIKNITKTRRNSILAIRALLIILITLGSIGFSLNSKSDITHTVFLVDRSASVSSQKENIELFINDSIKRKKANDRVSIVSFAADLSTEYSSFIEKRKITLDSIINKNATNYEDALALTKSIILPSENGRLVFISDGLENQSDYSNIVQELELRNIEFKFVKVSSNIISDSQISNMKIPTEITVGESFQIELEIFSSKDTSAILRVFKGSDIFSEKEIDLNKGKNNFTYKDTLDKSGNQIYSAQVDMQGDYYANNNKFSMMTNGIGSPRLLVIEDENASGEFISKLAIDNGFKVDNYITNEAPIELKNLVKYQAVIMSNVTLEETPKKFIDSLETYVKDFGGGLVTIGGDNSYALGGYYKTKLEDMLPVNMEMKRDGMLPSVSMVLIIDRSGSMDGSGASKMEMAKEAARKAVSAMKPNDKMAVLAFDDTRIWVSKLKSADEKDDIIDAIGTISVGGGTSILPALKEGISELIKSDSKLRHIILLTDGQAETNGYDSVISEAVENEITISTIAVGPDSDVRLLEYISTEGLGRFYSVINPESIPSIFTKETFLASKSYINDEKFTPIITSDSEIVKPLYLGSSDVLGYVSTSLKSNAEILLKTDKDEPLLATWNYGLGKVSSWTSDGGLLWSNAILSNESGKNLFLNIISDVLIDNNLDDINISTSQNGSNVDIILGKDELSTAQVLDEISIIDKDGNETKYTGEIYNNQFVKTNIKNMEEGLYIIKSSAMLDGKKIYKTSPLLINYSNEYDITTNEDVSADMVKKFGGSFIEESSEVFTEIKSKVYDEKEISSIILIIALFIFLLDIYVRRFRNDKITNLVKNINYKLDIKFKSYKIKLNSKKLYVTKKKSEDLAYNKTENNIKSKIVLKSEKSKDVVKVDENKTDMTHLDRLLKAKDKRK